MTEADPLRDVLDRVLSRMHHSMKRLSYRLRSEDDSPEVREIVDEYLGEIAYESEVIAFYMAEHPAPVTHTEYGMKTSPTAWVAPTGTRNRAQAATEGMPEAIIVSREVTDWAPVKNLSPSPEHAKNWAETLHDEET